MQKNNSKKIILFITLIALLVTLAFSGFNSAGNVEASVKMKTLKSSQYKKMIQGGLSKQEVGSLLAYMSSSRRSLSSKDITNNVKSGNYNMLLNIFRTKLDPKYGEYRNYSIKKVNKLFSSITSFKFKKNKKYNDYMFTDSSRLNVASGEEGFDYYIVTKSAKYNSKKLEIKYELHDYLAEENYGYKTSEGTFKATFKKLKNGKYRLNSIKKMRQSL